MSNKWLKTYHNLLKILKCYQNRATKTYLRVEHNSLIYIYRAWLFLSAGNDFRIGKYSQWLISIFFCSFTIIFEGENLLLKIAIKKIMLFNIRFSRYVLQDMLFKLWSSGDALQAMLFKLCSSNSFLQAMLFKLSLSSYDLQDMFLELCYSSYNIQAMFFKLCSLSFTP